MHHWNYKIYSYLARIGDMARARGGHQVTKFRIILIHGRRRYGGSAYRVPDTSADTGHVESGCRQHLEAIRHWKRPSATGSDRFPTPRISARGRRALLDERARLLLARYMDHGTTQRKWIDSLVSSEDLVRWS